MFGPAGGTDEEFERSTGVDRFAFHADLLVVNIDEQVGEGGGPGGGGGGGTLGAGLGGKCGHKQSGDDEGRDQGLGQGDRSPSGG